MIESVTYTVEIVYKIQGFDSYGFGKDKHLYNLKTNRRLKQSLKNGMIGYWLYKRFYSLKSLKPLLYKPSKETCPFN